MRTTITTATVLLLTMTAAGPMLAGESLFSRVSARSVFDSPPGGPAGPSQAPLRVPGPASLSDMLQSAGLEPREISTKVLSVKIEREKWSIPVLFTFSEDRGQIRMVMLLSTLEEDQKMPAEKLMALLEANRENQEATFAYSVKRRRIELHRVMENRSLTAERLRLEAEKLAEIAEKTQDLWTIDGNSPPPAQTADPEAQPQPTPVPTPAAPSLVGKWAASRSATQAFALQINADGTFAMVTVAGGKTAKSTGKYTLSGSLLTLVDDKGTRLAGQVESTSADEFKFSPQNASKAASSLTFKRAT